MLNEQLIITSMFSHPETAMGKKLNAQENASSEYVLALYRLAKLTK